MSRDHGRKAALALEVAATALAIVALAVTGLGYGRWSRSSRAYHHLSTTEKVRLLAAPAAWIPGVLEATAEDAVILSTKTTLDDEEWTAAYYLYPRTLLIRPQVAPRGAELAAMAEQAGAGWVITDGQLMAVVAGRLVAAPPPPAGGRDGGRPPLPPGAPGPRHLAALLALVLAALGWGRFLLRLAGVAGPPTPTPAAARAGHAGAALVLGLGIMGGLGMALALAGLFSAATAWLLTAVGVVLLPLAGPRPAAAAGAEQPSPPDAGPLRLLTKPWSRQFILGVLVLLAALPLARSLAEPMQHWDERFQWAQKAKIIFHEGGVRGPGFQALDRPHLHRHYPLLVPCLEAQLAHLAGAPFAERAAKGLFPIFFVGLLLVVSGSLSSLVAAPVALVITLLLAALPPLHHASRIQGGAAHTGFADLPLAALGAVILWLLLSLGGSSRRPASSAVRRGHGAWWLLGLTAGLASLCKPEGVGLAAGAMVAAFMAGRRLSSNSLALPARALLAALLIMLPRLLLTLTVPATGTIGYSGDEAYLARLSVDALGTGLSDHFLPAVQAMLAAPFSRRWAAVGLLPTAGLLLCLLLRRRGGHELAPLVLVPLAVDLVAYTLTASDIRWHLAVSLDRLWLQVMPAVLVIAAAQMRRLRGG